MKQKAVDVLAKVFTVSGVFDVCGALFFTFLVGVGRRIAVPQTDPFYALLIATFLLSFGVLQIGAARDIRRYLVTVGAVLLSRVLFGVLFFTYLLTVRGFPTSLLPTAIADIGWALLYAILAVRSEEISLRDLFDPRNERA